MKYQYYKIELMNILDVIPSEEINDHHVNFLAKEILKTHTWTHPIPIDINTKLIMDGNHRYKAAIDIGLKYIPVFLLEYSDKNVTVFHSNQPEKLFPIRSILDIVKSQELLPYKSTKHLFYPVLPTCNININKLI